MHTITLVGEIWMSINFSSGWTFCYYDWGQQSDVQVRELIVFKDGKHAAAYIDPADRVDWFKKYYQAYPIICSARIESDIFGQSRSLSMIAGNGDSLSLSVQQSNWIDYSEQAHTRTETGKEVQIIPVKLATVIQTSGSYNGTDLGEAVALPYSIRPGDYELPKTALINNCRMELEN